jgi:hypothetical protein
MDDKEIELWERKRNDALAGRDDVGYYLANNALGYEPEDMILYQRGSDIMEMGDVSWAYK